MDFDTKFGKEGLTFDDVAAPAASNVFPGQVDTSTRITKRSS